MAGMYGATTSTTKEMVYQPGYCGLLLDVKLMFDELNMKDSKIGQSSAGSPSVRRVVSDSRSRKRLQGYWNEDE